MKAIEVKSTDKLLKLDPGAGPPPGRLIVVFKDGHTVEREGWLGEDEGGYKFTPKPGR